MPEEALAFPQPQLTPPQPQPAVTEAAKDQPHPAQSSPTNLPEHASCKSRLHEYTQKSWLALPIYQVVNEGIQHAPLFRATVLVDGTHYTSSNAFSHKRSAEHDVAKVALDALMQRKKDEGCAFIHENTIFCKSILHEYAAKLHLENPTYQTNLSRGVLPVFVSSLVFNGVAYTGQVAGTKKEAEQLAARAVILSIMDSPNSGSDIMARIIKSKSKLYAVHDKLNVSNTPTAAMPMVPSMDLTAGSTLSGGKEIVHSIAASNVSRTAIIAHSSGQVSYIPVAKLPIHEFKKPKLVTPLAPVNLDPPIVFVPPVHEQPLSAKKRRKKAKKSHRPILEFPYTVVPASQLSSSISRL